VTSRLNTALNIFEREYTRIFTWANGLVDTWSAHQVCYAAFSAPFYRATTGQHTSKGAVHAVYWAAEAPLRRAAEIRGSYLAAGSWWRTEWPTYAEALELSELYCALVYVSITDGWTFKERAACMTALRMYRPATRVPLWDTLQAYDGSVIKETLAAVAAVLSPARPRDDDAAAVAREVWDRERYRLRKTYMQRGHLMGGAADGEEQQDHDPGDSGPTYRNDQLAGLWQLRSADAESGVRRAGKPAAD
jgi:hypothetical protein